MFSLDGAGNGTRSNVVTVTPQGATGSTTPTAGVGPSGVPMPSGTFGPWTEIFADDFNQSVPLGQFPAAVSSKWDAYRDGWRDTYGNGMYAPTRVNSIHDGVLDFYLHDEDAVRLVSAPMPKVGGVVLNQLYGRYTMRFKTDSLSNYYAAWLQWPKSEAWPRDGELDFPEGALSGEIKGFVHYQDGTWAGDQAWCHSGVPFAGGWHTVTQEWTPTMVRYILDGTVVCTVTQRIPNTPMRFVIQTETGSTPFGTQDGHLLIDWFVASQYTP